MSTPEEEVQEGRKKRTVLLLAGGTVSLILPLLGVVYIKMNEAKASRPPDGSVMFDRREGGESKINVSQTVTINPAVSAAAPPGPGQSSLPVPGQAGMTPGGGSSLDMVKGGNSYYQDKPAEAPKASTPTPASAAPAPEPAPSPKTAAKKGPKPFTMPKLQGTKSISNNFSQKSPRPTGAQGMTGVADPQAKGGDMNDMLKNVPGGIDNPEVQKLIQQNKK